MSVQSYDCRGPSEPSHDAMNTQKTVATSYGKFLCMTVALPIGQLYHMTVLHMFHIVAVLCIYIDHWYVYMLKYEDLNYEQVCTTIVIKCLPDCKDQPAPIHNNEIVKRPTVARNQAALTEQPAINACVQSLTQVTMHMLRIPYSVSRLKPLATPLGSHKQLHCCQLGVAFCFHGCPCGLGQFNICPKSNDCQCRQKLQGVHRTIQACYAPINGIPPPCIPGAELKEICRRNPPRGIGTCTLLLCLVSLGNCL